MTTVKTKRWYATASSPHGTVYSAGDHRLIVPYPPEGSTEHTHSDARLIALAPELLAFVRVLNHVDSDEGYCICPANNGGTADRYHASVCVNARALLARAEARP